jgi:predicted HD phosphohydrolase
MKISVINQIQNLFDRYGGKNYGESCSQLTHSVNSAWHAQQDGAERNLIIAAFLHDIGHFIAEHQQILGVDEYGHQQHADIAANWLAERGIPANVYQPIRYHVLAKRYLMTKSNENDLSKASYFTFMQQGGLLSPIEQHNFEHNKYFHQALNLRKYDDLGKPFTSTFLTTMPLITKPWFVLIEQVLAENNT